MIAVVVRVFQESADASDDLEASRRALDACTQAAALTRHRRTAGLADRRDTLVSEERLLLARNEAPRARQAAFDALITLGRAFALGAHAGSPADTWLICNHGL